ncbi:hypothetical protein [Staphylothermus hellenicus]|uniref:VWFA domain-containing protein n=1 Tax=Staphylothermus hellenicus (strain DSM 12710 / JCM 10830 / BK20S6-10-b1 / P8) TaxID=591019 RepID=D7D993_STAHD|nr:hypothetical protein [Staphylothermus hellenicus]ADI32339.1 hypothetical protein Shell_1241 [Staphylothermus hellenicus DSM 12710]
MIDIVIVAEKSYFIDVGKVVKFLNTIKSRILNRDMIRLGLVVFSKWAAPFMDLTTDFYRVDKIYESIPVVKGRPEPALGLYEAGDMLIDFDEGLGNEKVLVLISSLTVKPRIPLRLAIIFLESLHVNLYLLTTSRRKPKWLSELPENIVKNVFILRDHNMDKIVRNIFSY